MPVALKMSHRRFEALVVATLLLGSASAYAATDAAPGKVKPCTLSAEQKQELAAIRKELAGLEAASRPASSQADALLGRVDRLSHELVGCVRPEIDRMTSQAGKPGTPAAEIQAVALRLATDLKMPAEERQRLIAELQRDTQGMEAGTLETQAQIFALKLQGEVGRALNELEAAKRRIQAVR